MSTTDERGTASLENKNRSDQLERFGGKMNSKLGPLWALAFAIGAVQCAANLDRQEEQPSCLGEDGNPVDWFIAYKFPTMSEQPQPFKSGLSYAYITSKPADDDSIDIEEVPTAGGQPIAGVQPTFLDHVRAFLGRYLSGSAPSAKRPAPRRTISRKIVEAEASSSKWIVSKRLITDPESIVLRSLKASYAPGKAPDSLNWIIYNDQPPKDESLRGPSHSKAHAKGIVIMDTKNRAGVWLTHSVPQFPPPLGQPLHFDDNVSKFGQTFMCINFDVKLAGLQIAHHLSNMNALIYDSRITGHLFDLIPGLDALRTGWGERGSRRRKGDQSQAKLAQVISTRAGQELSIYSKSYELEADLYASWLEHELDSSLYVETWRNGNGHPLNSSCSEPDYKVNNVKELRLYDDEGTVFSWPYHKDHSKWAISETKEKGVVCVADINRMESQFERGGGAVCMICPNCWSVFSKTILDIEPCDTPPKRGAKKKDRHPELAK